MGMTIEEAIEKLSASVLIIGPEDWGDARDILLSTARKYQKIERIYANIDGFTAEDHIVHKIQSILSRWAVSEHPELTKVEYFDKIVELMNEKGK